MTASNDDARGEEILSFNAWPHTRDVVVRTLEAGAT